MDYKTNYPTVKNRLSYVYKPVKTYIQKVWQPCKRRLSRYIEPAIADISETKEYYLSNAKYGWIRGRRLAKQQNFNSVKRYIYETGSAIAKTKIRAKDIVPLITCVLFSVTNPFVGMGILGFALGQKFNTKIINGLKYIKNSLLKLKIR